jgi:hypothetical protein
VIGSLPMQDGSARHRGSSGGPNTRSDVETDALGSRQAWLKQMMKAWVRPLSGRCWRCWRSA